MGAYYRIDLIPKLPAAKRRRACQKARDTSRDIFARLFRSHEAAREALAQLPQPELFVVRPSGTYFVGNQ